MTSDPQAPHLAILGAGPVGLEAALAASEAGYPFTLYEAAPEVAAHVRAWRHVRLFSPWDLDVSPRMRRHLEAAGQAPPEDDACPTGAELVEKVLQPLAELPEIAAHLALSTRVLGISRQGTLKHDEIGTGRRAERPFRLLVETPGGDERIDTADAVLDCTGTWGRPAPLGDGGIPAPGERALAGEISRHIPDVATEAEEWAGKRILLVGAGHSAQTAVRDLARLAEEREGTKVIWLLRRPDARPTADEDDPLPERARLTARAGELADGDSPHVAAMRGAVVEAVGRRDGDGLVVTLRRHDGELQEIEVDRVLSLTGSVGDPTLYRELQVHECYATAGPMKLAAALLAAGGSGGDCLDQESHGADTLVNPEPGFFLLGSKAYGRNNTFLMRVGWQQVEEVFGVLGVPDETATRSS